MKINIINKQQEELLAREAVEKGKIKLALEKSYVEPGRQQGRLLVQCEKKGYRAPPVVSLLVSSFFFIFYFFHNYFFTGDNFGHILTHRDTWIFFFGLFFRSTTWRPERQSDTFSKTERSCHLARRSNCKFVYPLAR